jgi:hypothetical protein
LGTLTLTFFCYEAKLFCAQKEQNSTREMENEEDISMWMKGIHPKKENLSAKKTGDPK